PGRAGAPAGPRAPARGRHAGRRAWTRAVGWRPCAGPPVERSWSSSWVGAAGPATPGCASAGRRRRPAGTIRSAPALPAALLALLAPPRSPVTRERVAADPEEPRGSGQQVAPAAHGAGRRQHGVAGPHDRRLRVELDLHQAAGDHDELRPLVALRPFAPLARAEMDEEGAQPVARVVEQGRHAAARHGPVAPGDQVTGLRPGAEQVVDP